MFCEFCNSGSIMPSGLIDSLNRTDIGIMAIPLPMLFQTSLSLGRKLVLGILFSSGTFVVICAILRAYYSLVNISSNAVALGWASREVLVAAIVVCSPTIKPLVSECKRNLSDRYTSGTWNSRGASNHGMSKLTGASHQKYDDLVTIGSSGQKRGPTYKMTVMGRNHTSSESQDHINVIPEADDNSTNSNSRAENGIVVKTEFEVSRH